MNYDIIIQEKKRTVGRPGRWWTSGRHGVLFGEMRHDFYVFFSLGVAKISSNWRCCHRAVKLLNCASGCSWSFCRQIGRVLRVSLEILDRGCFMIISLPLILKRVVAAANKISGQLFKEILQFFCLKQGMIIERKRGKPII